MSLHYKVNTVMPHANQLCMKRSSTILNYCVNNIHATRTPYILNALECSKVGTKPVLRKITQWYSKSIWDWINRLTIVVDIVALTLTKAGGYEALTEIRMTSAPNNKYTLPGATLMHTKLSKAHLGPLQLFPVLF